MKLGIDLYSDGAVIEEMAEAFRAGVVKGFTTNPTLMRKAGVNDYKAFARQALDVAPGLPISFEVLADDLPGMERQAREIASWGSKVFVKIPIATTNGESTQALIRTLALDGIQVNVTAVLTVAQVNSVAEVLDSRTAAIVSVFAGRIADTGRDPVPTMLQARSILTAHPKVKLLWASTRELINVFQAQACQCDIITVTPDILKKLTMVGMDLEQLSLDTVKMFRRDALAAGFDL